MFQLTAQKAKLSDVNPRAEKHGEDNMLACDLKFEVTAANDILSQFDPDLRAAFYYLNGHKTQPDLIETPGHLPDLRFPFIDKPLAWGKEFAGYRLEIAHGIDQSSAIFLDPVHVDGFRFEMQEGGTVVLTMRVQCHPDAPTIGMLCDKIQGDVELTLTPPPALPVGDDSDK